MSFSDDGGNTFPAAEPSPAHLSAITVFENVDMLTLILIQLQGKPLMRFKSVSKQWLSLISSPNFSLLHTIQNPNPKPSALFFASKPQTHEIAYEFVPLDDNHSSLPFRFLRFSHDPSIIDVLSSCNGLLLCSPKHPGGDDRKVEPAYIYNPTTKQSSVLNPPPGGSSVSAKNTLYGFAFDPSKSPHCYKVVLVRAKPGSKQNGLKDMFEFHLYSSETRSWKKLEHEVEWPAFYEFDAQGIYLNGAVHWASKKAGSICFDLDQECTRAMPGPPGHWRWEDSVIRYFGESGGDLHLVDIQGYQVMVIDVYVLQRDYSKWTRKYRVDMDRLLGSYPRMISSVYNPLHMDFYNFSVLGLLKVGDDDHELVFHVKGTGVISYSCMKQTIKELLCDSLPGKIYHEPLYRLRSFDGHLYSETLAGV